MARINVEDDIESTAEWKRLLKLLQGDEARAIGLLVLFWRRAQKLWGHGQLVPESDIADFGWEPLVKSGWAKKEDGGYYAIGAKDRFAWYVQRVEAGKHRWDVSERDEQSAKRDSDSATRDEVSVEPPSPSPAPSPALIPNTAHRGTKAFLEAAYKTYPRKVGKTRAFKKLEKEIRTEDDFNALLAAIEKYKKCDEVKRGFVKHFSTFAGEWRDWLDADAGQVNGRAPKPMKQLADLEHEEHPHAP